MDPRLVKELKELKHQCKVCEETAAGFHFGAFTCEGCKSFFGRCSDGSKAWPSKSFPPCKSGGNCSVKGRSRTGCKRCRWEKCLQAGMSRSNSRYGRRSHYFKVACLEEQQQTEISRHGPYRRPEEKNKWNDTASFIYPTNKELELLALRQQMRVSVSEPEKMEREPTPTVPVHKPLAIVPPPATLLSLLPYILQDNYTQSQMSPTSYLLSLLTPYPSPISPPRSGPPTWLSPGQGIYNSMMWNPKLPGPTEPPSHGRVSVIRGPVPKPKGGSDESGPLDLSIEKPLDLTSGVSRAM